MKINAIDIKPGNVLEHSGRLWLVLKRELIFIPVVGWAMARAGNIAVERGDGPKALRSLLRQSKAALAEGRSILIYPEGTRTPVGSSLPYHAGTAALYRQPELWKKMQTNGMAQDVSWTDPARRYAALFRELLPVS